MITLPSGKTLPDNHTDQDISDALGPYSQEFGTPAAADWDYLIVAYDKARYASLNPVRTLLFDNYVQFGLDGNQTGQKDLIDQAMVSDQPNIDEEIDLELGGNGAANKSPGTVMAQRRFAYGYTSGPAYTLTPPATPVMPPSGPIVYTLVPPPPYQQAA